MSGRDVHDRLNDHFSTDLDTNAVLNGAVGSIASGSTVHAALLALVGGGALLIKEVDGSPSVTPVKIIRVSNGTLTDDGGGQVTITTGGGGGGGSITVELLDGSGGVGSVTILRIGSFVDNGGGDVSLLPQISASSVLPVLDFGTANTQTSSPDYTASVNVKTNGLVTVVGEHTPGSGFGFVIDVGSDDLLVNFAEQSSGHLQVSPTTGASYSIELLDDPFSNGSLVGRFAHLDDGGNASYPGLGMLRRLSAAPTPQFEGESYYDTTLHLPRFYNGTTWVNF